MSHLHWTWPARRQTNPKCRFKPKKPAVDHVWPRSPVAALKPKFAPFDSCHRECPMDDIFSRVTSDHAPENEHGQQGKQQAEEEPADQKFPNVVGIQTKSQEQPGKLRHPMAFAELIQRILYLARLGMAGPLRRKTARGGTLPGPALDPGQC